MSAWGWTPERHLGIWRHGAGWLRPTLAAVPYVTVGVLLLMLLTLGGTLSSAKGVLFDLPDTGASDVGRADLVALVMPVKHETMVFFDDSRYLLGDETSMRGFAEDLSARLAHRESRALLVLGDRRVSTGNLMSFVSLCRKSGVDRVLVACKQTGGDE